MKKLLVLFLVLTLGLSLFSCGGTEGGDGTDACTEHVDKNLDSKCDECGAAMPNSECTSHKDANSDGKCDVCGTAVQASDFEDITLVRNGVAAFRFVLANDLSEENTATFGKYILALRSAGLYPEVVEDTNESLDTCEVLIGEVTGRGAKYTVPCYTLGRDGYVIKGIDEKIIVNGGSETMLNIAIELFFENILGLDLEAPEKTDEVIFTEDDQMIEIQSDYEISDITVLGKSIRNMNIAADPEDELFYDMALLLRDAFYTSAGIYVDVVPLSEASASSITVARVPDDGKWGFKIYPDGESLKIECGFANAFEKTFVEFINKEIKLKTGVVDFGESYLYAKEVRVVRYEDFGARGDGTTDDFFAIKAAHDYANEGGQTVVGKPRSTYRIHSIVNSEGRASSIKIKTDVIWEGVKFIIDDRGFTHNSANNGVIFTIASDYSAQTISNKQTIKDIFSSLTIEEGYNGTINWSGFGYDALIVVTNKNHKQFIRYGYNTAGSDQRELIVVDENGQIDSSTPFMFDYEDITSITIYRMDEKHITIKGGEINHIASDVPQTTLDGVAYFSRRITVARSNTTIDGLVHLISGELPGTKVNTEPKGPPYSGFLYPTNCANITIKNVVLTGRRYSGLHGTYDFQASTVNNLYLYNVTQSNYYKEDGVTPTMDYKNYWGIGGTSYCKNMVYDTCLLSRYDAHEGLYNGKVINSTVCNMELTGAGDMLIENTTFTPISNTPIMLRSDYGCTWRGNLTVKDCTIKSAVKTGAVLLGTGWYNHYFGYTCYMPNLILNNITWENLTDKTVYITTFKNPDNIHEKNLIDGQPNANPYTPAEYITVTNHNGITYKLYGSPFFLQSELTGVEIEFDLTN